MACEWPVQGMKAGGGSSLATMKQTVANLKTSIRSDGRVTSLPTVNDNGPEHQSPPSSSTYSTEVTTH